jgi:hypothetical protein
MKRAVPVAALLFWMTASSWGQVRVGPEFRVNSVTTGWHRRPQIAIDGDGDFVVVWSFQSPAAGIFARRFDATGTPLGDDFQVNSYTTDAQVEPSVAGTADGSFVVAWRQETVYPAPLVDDVFARRYDSGGTAVGEQFLVNSVTTDRQAFPSVASTAAGDTVVTWMTFPAAGSSSSLFGQRYDAGGSAQGAEFQINSSTTASSAMPAAAHDASGNLVVAWDGYGDGHGRRVVVRRFDATGVPYAPELQVNTYTTSTQRSAGLATAPDGGFVVVWVSRDQDGNENGVFGRRFDVSGTPLGGEFAVNTYTTSHQFHPDVAFDERGNFVIAWTTLQQEGALYDVFARLYDAAGAPQGGEFRVNVSDLGDEGYPSAAFDPTGAFVVAWEGYGGAGRSNDIFAQRFLPDLIFRDGFENAGLSAWSVSATGGGDLFRHAPAALKGTDFGLLGYVDDVSALYVQDDSAADEWRYRARFYVDAAGFDPGEAENHFRTRLFIAFEEGPSRRVATIVLRSQAMAYSLTGRARLDDNAQADTGFFPVTAGPHFVEIDLVPASGPDASDGSLEMWIDGASVAALSGLDNSRARVDFVRMGALSVKSGAFGTIYWDEFESRRTTYIGP